MKTSFFVIAFCLMTITVISQKVEDVRINRYIDFAGTIGGSQGSVNVAYVNSLRLFKKRKWEAGLGLRWTGYAGSNREFITAPARLARTKTTPFLIFFAGQRKAAQDTLIVHRPITSSVNVSLNAGYHVSPRWSTGFNIDLIGFTVGKKSPAILISNGQPQQEPAARPASFNLLLTGDHDLGSLNSEFFLRYRLNDVWSIRAIYEFIFVEYKTRSVKQVAPDGTVVDRFRNKANTFGLGLSCHLKTIRNL